MAWIGRAFIYLAVWSLKMAGRFVEANDKAALHAHLPLLRRDLRRLSSSARASATN